MVGQRARCLLDRHLVEAVRIEDPAGEFLQELAGLASDFAALQDAIGSTVSTLENANVGEESKAELEQAFADAPSCQSLQADS